MILNKKLIREIGYEQFEQEWESFRSSIGEITKKLIDSPFVLVPFNLEDTIEDFPTFLKLQKSEIEIFRSNLMNFMMLYDLRVGIYNEGDDLHMKFPISLSDYELKYGRKYSIKDIGSEYTQCKLKSSQFSGFIDFYLCVVHNYLLLCQPDDKETQNVYIKYKHPLRHIEMQIDRSNPRILCLVVKEVSNYLT